MPRLIWLNPLIVVATATVLAGLCAIIGRLDQLRWLLTAAGLCAAASVVGGVPLVLTRRNGNGSVIQGALVGMTAQMLLGLVGGATVRYTLNPGWGFMMWMSLFYWLSLILLAVFATQTLRSATVSQNGK